MGLLADIYSGSDSLKRKVKGLLADPLGTIEQKINQFGEDQQTAINNAQDATGFGGNRSVLMSPQQKQQARQAMGDYASSMGLAGTVGSYRGEHMAPMKGEGSAPLHDLAQIYPEDIYSSKAAQYYGHFGDFRDNEAVSLMQQAKARPNMPVTMYRAVPHEPSLTEQLALLEKQMAAYQRRGVTPDGSKGSGWFNSVYDKRDELRKAVETPQEIKKLAINNGDWVTLSKNYAKEHGESALNGKYKIISKKVPARKLFTDGNSIQEFGYDESGKINGQLLGAIAGGGLLGAGGYAAFNEK